MVSKMDKKSKKGVAVIISIGPKMKTKPTDAASPDMKKYGDSKTPFAQAMPDTYRNSMPMKKAFQMLKQNYETDRDEYLPEFGDEDAREAEMNQAERAAMMAEGVPEMRRPRSAPRPGDPRLRGSRRSDAPPNSEGYPPNFNSDVEDSAHNRPRPSMPRDIFQNQR